jgi:hypothetical protein
MLTPQVKSPCRRLCKPESALKSERKTAPSGKSHVMLLAVLLLISATRCTDMHELTRDRMLAYPCL